MILPDRIFPGDWIRDPAFRSLPRHAQLLLVMLQSLCDLNGRFLFSPADIHRALYAGIEDNVSARDVQDWLDLLVGRGLVKAYFSGSKGCKVGEMSKAIWRQKLKYGRALYDAEENQVALDLSATADPPRPPNRSEVKRRENRAADGGRGDVLFLSICQAIGSDPAKLTANAARLVASALNQLRRAEPHLSPDLIARAAAAFRQQWPWRDLNAHALATEWPRLQARATATAPVARPEDDEPLGWRDWINEHCPDSPYARGGDKEGAAWMDLDASHRRYLRQQVTRQTAAA